jgi:hypothetical protein
MAHYIEMRQFPTLTKFAVSTKHATDVEQQHGCLLIMHYRFYHWRIAKVVPAIVAVRKWWNVDGILLVHIKTMDGYGEAALRAPIQQHCLVTNAERVERDAPICTEIRNFVFRQADWTKLQAKPPALAVIHLKYKNPVQCAGSSEFSIQHPFILSDRRAPCDVFWRSCVRTKFIQQPSRGQSINVSVPYLEPISENQIAKRLHLQAMPMGQAHEPT